MRLITRIGNSRVTKVVLGAVILFPLGAILLGQERQDNSGYGEGRPEMTLTQQLGHFRKTSATADPGDPGNRIEAIRRLTLLVEDINSNQDRITRRIPRVEIELFSAIAPPPVNSHYIVRIGNKEFYPGGRGCRSDRHCTMVVMSPEEFASLSNGALISMRNGRRASPDDLSRLFEEGEPANVIGSKFGRLDKGMIERFPPVERPAVEP
jgi:hypothetical protein